MKWNKLWAAGAMVLLLCPAPLALAQDRTPHRVPNTRDEAVTPPSADDRTPHRGPDPRTEDEPAPPREDRVPHRDPNPRGEDAPATTPTDSQR